MKHSELPWVTVLGCEHYYEGTRLIDVPIYTEKVRGHFNDEGAGYREDSSYVDNIKICDISTYQEDITVEEFHANAEFIVKACNSHYQLLEALKSTLSMMDEYSYRQTIEGYNDILKIIKEAEK